MKQKFACIVLMTLILFAKSYAQSEFPIKIQDFSADYEAIIDLNQKDTVIISTYDEYVPKYSIQINNKKTTKTLLEAYTNDFPDYLINEANEAIPNIKELPYGSQSVLIYEDFNFDGVKDFALMNGNNSCYGGPSFDVYLVDKNGSLNYSEGFSDLSNSYCGMFQSDLKTKTISTMTKSGCCWHQFSKFEVVNNEPKLIKIIEESYRSGNNVVEVTEINYKNNKELRETKNYFPTEEITSHILFSFELQKNQKRVILYESGEQLNYVFIQKNELIELYYPPFNQEYTENDFVFNPNKNTLTFTNQSARYQIYQTEKTVGIKVTAKDKTYDLKGFKKSLNGNLKDLQKLGLKNTLIHKK